MPGMMGPGGLLDMAEQQPTPPWFTQGGQAVGVGGGSGPGGPGGYPQGGAIPPELAQYFGAGGTPKLDDPRQVAAEGGASLGQLAGGMFPSGGYGAVGYNVPNDRGGFFSLDSLLGLSGTPTVVPNMGPQGPGRNAHVERVGQVANPGGAAQIGSQLPSTNNWRLLGMGPGWIMRNGMLIDTNDPSGKFGFPRGADTIFSMSGENTAPGYHRFMAPGAGMMGRNVLDAYLWPGAVNPTGHTRWPYGTDV